jgi:hypothetical protein
MTDREVYEWLYRRYDKPDKSAEIEAWEVKRAEVEKAHAQRPIAERKAEFWAMCQEFGCPEADIQKQWDAYLKGES